MTTHEERTVVEETPEVSEHAAPADPSTASTQAMAPTPTLAEESAPGGEVPLSNEAAVAEPSNLEREPSTEEMLFADDELAELRARWAGVQAAFVDDPKECVQKADVLVSDLVDQLTSGFAQARSRLEEQWGRGEKASTEDLRLALMHYREFFERLLAV
jgi:hypothetical protein